MVIARWVVVFMVGAPFLLFEGCTGRNLCFTSLAFAGAEARQKDSRR